ncbi:MAG TPA: hypothetical protein DCF68_17655 [Cyanothece sp. UBA12306]|nr:hypothetical protein [Cyanothece sp. UBA12306]
MSQQLGIILMVDVEAAIKADTLKGNAYLFDNMKLQGSEGQGTDSLISAVNGTYWCDGSQANEQVLNWLPYGVGSLPPTIPKSFLTDKSKNSDLRALSEFEQLADRVENTEKDQFNTVTAIINELKKITASTGQKTKVKSKRKTQKRDLGAFGEKLMDVTGQLVDVSSEDQVPEINSLNPIITDITGEAVDKKIIYPAAYGSPDLVTDGWYWAASVDTSKPGIYAYTMHVQLYKLALDQGEWTWVPVDMTCDAYLKITSGPKVNGFTGGGIGMLPIM